MIGKKEIDEYEVKLDALRATIEANDAEIAGMTDKLNVLETEYQNLHPTINLANDRADAAEARVKELEKEVSLAAIELDKRCNRAERITALEQELAEAKDRVEQVQRDCVLYLRLLDQAEEG